MLLFNHNWRKFDHKWRQNISYNQEVKNSSQFPIRVGKLHYVVTAERWMQGFGLNVHVYDVALYLRDSNPVWTHSRDREKALKKIMCDGAIMLSPTTRFASRSGVADICMELDPFAAGYDDLPENFHDTCKEFCDIIRYGPDIRIGDMIWIRPCSDYVEMVINGKRMRSVKSSWVARVLNEMYLGMNSLLPQFRDAAWAQLSLAKRPTDIGDPVVDRSIMHLPVWLMVVAVLVMVASAGGCCGLLWYLFGGRRQAAVKGPGEKP